MAWLRCCLSFLLLRSAIACLRGARSHRGCPANYGALDLALIEGQVCDYATASSVLCLAPLTFCARGGGKGCQLPWVKNFFYYFIYLFYLSILLKPLRLDSLDL